MTFFSSFGFHHHSPTDNLEIAARRETKGLSWDVGCRYSGCCIFFSDPVRDLSVQPLQLNLPKKENIRITRLKQMYVDYLTFLPSNIVRSVSLATNTLRGSSEKYPQHSQCNETLLKLLTVNKTSSDVKSDLSYGILPST